MVPAGRAYAYVRDAAAAAAVAAAGSGTPVGTAAALPGGECVSYFHTNKRFQEPSSGDVLNSVEPEHQSLQRITVASSIATSNHRIIVLHSA
jgi:hypothetical protein